MGNGPGFLGVSTGRTGSTYMQRVMARAGISCTHERVYEARALGNRWDTAPVWNRPELGEWSAQAVPFLGQIDTGHVWHLVREPLAVVSSLMAFGLFRANSHGSSGAFMRHHFATTGQPLKDTIRYVVEWNRRIEPFATLRIAIEDVTADLVAELGKLLGVDVVHQAAQIAIDQVPTNTNAGDRHGRFSLADLPVFPATDELVAMADRYGYAC